jgi:hypothetical protein
VLQKAALDEPTANITLKHFDEPAPGLMKHGSIQASRVGGGWCMSSNQRLTLSWGMH